VVFGGVPAILEFDSEEVDDGLRQLTKVTPVRTTSTPSWTRLRVAGRAPLRWNSGDGVEDGCGPACWSEWYSGGGAAPGAAGALAPVLHVHSNSIS
jgi:hypothetical protein